MKRVALTLTLAMVLFAGPTMAADVIYSNPSDSYLISDLLGNNVIIRNSLGQNVMKLSQLGFSHSESNTSPFLANNVALEIFQDELTGNLTLHFNLQNPDAEVQNTTGGFFSAESKRMDLRFLAEALDGREFVNTSLNIDSVPAQGITDPGTAKALFQSSVQDPSTISNPTPDYYMQGAVGLNYFGIPDTEGPLNFNSGVSSVYVEQLLIMDSGSLAGSFLALDTAEQNFTITPIVPEPATMGMLAIGGLGLLRRRRNRRRTAA